MSAGHVQPEVGHCQEVGGHSCAGSVEHQYLQSLLTILSAKHINKY